MEFFQSHLCSGLASHGLLKSKLLCFAACPYPPPCGVSPCYHCIIVLFDTKSLTAWNDCYFAICSTYPEQCLTLTSRIEVNSRCISESECIRNGWNLTGPACGVAAVTESVPDVFFLSLILFVGTFSLAYFFRVFRNSRYFPSRVSHRIFEQMSGVTVV